MKKVSDEKLNRRNFIKVVSAGAVAAGAALYGCSPSTGSKMGNETNDGVPTDKMTYRTNPSTKDKVSLLGFGCMRFPTLPKADEDGNDIDQKAVNKLVDYAIAHGINYFDTSPHYCQGFSEAAIGKALKKYPRNKFYIATKLSNFPDDPELLTREGAMNMYLQSFKELQVDTIDYYLLHAVGGQTDDMDSMSLLKARFIDNGMLDFLLKEREKGHIRNLGFSFHGDVAVYDYLLSLNVKWDFVQIMLNYVDWDHAANDEVNANYLYGELLKRHIPAVIMEPLRGGRLARLNFQLLSRLKQIRPNDNPAAWAFRFAGSFPDVLTVLSGMTYLENIQQNVQTYSPLQPVTEKEKVLLEQIVEEIQKFPYIQCTACQYCMPCPYGINIPGIFAHYNKCLDEGNYSTETQDPNYKKARRAFLIDLDRQIPRDRQPDHCIACGQCVPKCPQQIQIPDEMQKIDVFVNDLKKQGTNL